MPCSALRPIANLVLGNQRLRLSSFEAWLGMDALEEATSRAECMRIQCLRTKTLSQRLRRHQTKATIAGQNGDYIKQDTSIVCNSEAMSACPTPDLLDCRAQTAPSYTEGSI